MSPRTDLVTVFLPITGYGAMVVDAEVTVRPNLDQACPGNVDGITAEVWIQDRNDDRVRCSDADATTILARVKAEQPDVWREITEMAEFNFKDGATPARAA